MRRGEAGSRLSGGFNGRNRAARVLLGAACLTATAAVAACGSSSTAAPTAASLPTPAAAAAVASVSAAAGTGTGAVTGTGTAGGSGSQTPPLGAAALTKAVAGKTVLVVGDSWAANLGVGMSAVASSTATIVNAGIGGCGIMLPDPSTTNATCSAWPTAWPTYMTKYKPDAVVLTVGFFDVTPQKLTGESAAHDLSDPAHLAVFENHLDKAIGILSAHGTPLYLMNSALVDKPAYHASALAMNQALATAVRTHTGLHLLDVHAQLCNDTGCPRVIDGINVYDPTQHPAPAARDRLADWALDTIFPAQSVS